MEVMHPYRFIGLSAHRSFMPGSLKYNSPGPEKGEKVKKFLDDLGGKGRFLLFSAHHGGYPQMDAD
jgi:hypothetical protein